MKTADQLEDRRAKIRDVLARVDQRYGRELPEKVGPGFERLHREAEGIERELAETYGRAIA
jgi:hypothetical protein